MNALKFQFKLAISFIMLLVLVSLPVATAFAAIAGPNYAQSEVDGGGVYPWTIPPGSLGADDNTYAYAAIPIQTTSNYIRATNFGFSIPADQTILGIEVTMGKYSTNVGLRIRDEDVYLLKAGTVTGTDHALGGNWNTSEAVAAYGNGTDLWGTSWTPAEINAADFGVAISAYNRSTVGENNAYIDYVQVTIYYGYTTTTSVVCVEETIGVGAGTTCVATVTRVTGSGTPTGTIDWISDGPGNFETSPCALSEVSDGIASCAVSYTPTSVGDGSHLITGAYGGDANFYMSSGNQTVTVNKATPTLSVTNSPQAYNGSPQAATVTPSVAGIISDIKYDGASMEPTNAGIYAVTADFVPTDTVNYNSLEDASAGTFEITKITPTLAVDNSPQAYNGSPQAATITPSVAGIISDIKYDGASMEPTNAGIYAVTADFIPTDTTNYNSLEDTSAGTFEITKITPTLAVDNSPRIYTGSPQAVTITPSVAGAVSDIQYDGSTTTPTNVGTYAITADFTPADTTNYNSLEDTSAGDFIINKATPTLSVTNSPVIYNGSQQTAVISASVPGSTVSDIKYDLSSTAPTDAGSYAVTGDFTPTDTTNYNSLDDATAGIFIINKITPTLSVTNSPQTYDGSSKTAIVTANIAGDISDIQYNGSPTPPTDAGTYAITADFTPTDTTNYNSLEDGAAGDFDILKARPTLSVTNSPVTYNGLGQAAVVTGSVSGTVSNINYDGNPALPVNAGTYAVTASFTPDDTTNYESLVGEPAGNLVINKRPITVTADPQHKTVGQPDPVLTYQITLGSLAAGDAFSGVLAREAGETVGVYAITIGSLALSDNYELTFVGANLTIGMYYLYLPLTLSL